MTVRWPGGREVLCSNFCGSGMESKAILTLSIWCKRDLRGAEERIPKSSLITAVCSDFLAVEIQQKFAEITRNRSKVENTRLWINDDKGKLRSKRRFEKESVSKVYLNLIAHIVSKIWKD